MDATLNHEEELLASSAGRVADDLTKGWEEPSEGSTDRAWRILADSGLLNLRLPEALGGGGASAVDAALCAEAFATRLSRVALVGPLMALEFVALSGGAGDELSELGSGARRTTIALELGLSDVMRHSDGDGIAFDAAGATQALMLVPDRGKWQLAVCQLGDEVPSADVSRRFASLSKDPPSRLAAFLDHAAFDRWRAFGLTMLCADMVGAMQAALNMGVEHARSRHQFGRPIGSFQAIQHLCAEQHVNLEASRSATYYAAWAVDGLSPADALVAARVAKAYVSRVSTQVVEAVMQIYGGLGQSWECTAHLFLRRVLADRTILGDDRSQEVALAPCIGGNGRQMSDST